MTIRTMKIIIMTLNLSALTIPTFRINNTFSNDTQHNELNCDTEHSTVMPSATCYTITIYERHNAKYRYAEYRYAECYFAQRHSE